MTQRKCGTCRYFEEGGIAASGWCRHPERQELQHMVLVRKTELACRDGWDHDLWEPRDGSGDGGNGNGGSGGYHQRRGSGQAMGEKPAMSHVGGGRDTRHSTGQDAEGNPGPGSLSQVLQMRPTQHGSADELSQDRQSLDVPAIFSSHSQSGEPSDEIREETFSTRGFQNASPLTAPGGEASVADPNRPGQGRTRAPGRDDLNPFNGRGSDASGRFGAPRGEPFENGWSAHREDQAPDEEFGPVEQSGATEPFDVTEPEFGATEPYQDRYADAGEAPPASEFDEDPGGQTGGPDIEDSDGTLNVPLSVQQGQCCRTCRDFRPAEGGRRGWCNNPFAFEQRQQVDADDLACRGTFGSWWAPTDDWWIERADIAHHSTPTPMVDELIREVQQRQNEAPGSTEKRKRS